MAGLFISKQSYQTSHIQNESLRGTKQRNIIRFEQLMIKKMFFLFAFEGLLPLAYCHHEPRPRLRELG
jgi:hypothetical protein